MAALLAHSMNGEPLSRDHGALTLQDVLARLADRERDGALAVPLIDQRLRAVQQHHVRQHRVAVHRRVHQSGDARVVGGVHVGAVAGQGAGRVEDAGSGGGRVLPGEGLRAGARVEVTIA